MASLGPDRAGLGRCEPPFSVQNAENTHDISLRGMQHCDQTMYRDCGTLRQSARSSNRSEQLEMGSGSLFQNDFSVQKCFKKLFGVALFSTYAQVSILFRFSRNF